MSFKLPYKQEMYKKRKHYLDSIKILSGCVDCKVYGPAEILSFDHVRGEKLFGIGQRWDIGQNKLEEEIAKCEVVCHNCHALRTNKRIKENEKGLPPFEPFPKIYRLNRNIIITEKIDGSNAMVWVDGDGDVWAGSRNRWITPDNDNFGFAAWVQDHTNDFVDKGPGLYSGEWWGNGIQRGYGLPSGEKRFSLFNVARWNDPAVRPACCSVVPTLYCGPFDEKEIKTALAVLKGRGSFAAPFMNPEGIVVFHTQGNISFKVTLEGDASGKTEDKSAAGQQRT